MNHTTKEQLLQTPMHKLGLTDRCNAFFYHRLVMKETEVMSVQEFMHANARIRLPKERFITKKLTTVSSDRYSFSATSSHWTQLRHILKEAGCTPADWAMLLPTAGKVIPIAQLQMLTKEQLLTCVPLWESFFRRKDTDSVFLLMVFLYQENLSEWEEEDFQFRKTTTIAQLMAVTEDQVLDALKGRNAEKSIYIKNLRRSSFLSLLRSAQEKLRILGCTPKDGPFMNIGL